MVIVTITLSVTTNIAAGLKHILYKITDTSLKPAHTYYDTYVDGTNINRIELTTDGDINVTSSVQLTTGMWLIAKAVYFRG